MICNWTMIIPYTITCFSCIQGYNLLTYLLIISAVFIFGARNFYSRRTWYEKNWRRKLAPKNGLDLWRRFLDRVSWVLLYHDAPRLQFNPGIDVGRSQPSHLLANWPRDSALQHGKVVSWRQMSNDWLPFCVSSGSVLIGPRVFRPVLYGWMGRWMEWSTQSWLPASYILLVSHRCQYRIDSIT